MTQPAQTSHAGSSTSPEPTTTTASTAARGMVGGLAGGVVFGMLMQMMDMLPMVASLVGGSSVALGWVVHLAISAVLGVGFALVAGRWVSSLPAMVGLGAAYGVVWWVLGALVLMPATLGMDLFMLNDMTMKSLMGHLIFGVILGGVVSWSTNR